MTAIGDRYGRLVVLEAAEGRHTHKRWLCQCDCGEQTVAWQISLRRGSTVSCGCHKREINKRRWGNYQKNGKGFWSKVDRAGGPDACWPWIGCLTDQGYVRTSHKGKPYSGHRLAWLLTHGKLDPHAVLRHRCDNKKCCNPAHLIPGTQLENIADAKRRGLYEKARHKGTKNGRAKLNYDAAQCIRRAYGLGLSQTLIAEIFGVSQVSVSKIIQFKRYAEPE